MAVVSNRQILPSRLPKHGLTGLLNRSEVVLGVPGKAHGWGMSDKAIGEAGPPLII